MGIEIAVALVLVVALNVYALTGGADFGGGVWDLLASGARKDAQRKLIKTVVAPIWEANHVWLIVVVVLLFACFPLAFTVIMTALHIPLTLMVIGIVLRGSAFVFQSFEYTPEISRKHWSAVFEAASVVTPVMLGVCVGALATGTMRVDLKTQRVLTDFVDAWWQPFPWAVGVMLLCMFSFLAAIYLAREAGETALADDFRARALAAGVVLGLVALPTLWLARHGAPQLYARLLDSPEGWRFQGVVAVSAVACLGALWKRRYQLARALAGLQVSAMVWGFAVGLQPYLIVPDVTVTNAAAPRSVLWPVLSTLSLGMVLLIPSFAILYRVFDRARRRA